MTTFGWCFGPAGSTGDHKTCPIELGQHGVIVRCGCSCHESTADVYPPRASVKTLSDIQEGK